MYKKFLKRLIDILISLLVLPVFIVLSVILIPLIKLEDKGPAFYLAPRIGKECKVFNMYKFRTMSVNAPDIRNEDGSTYNSKDDFRQTRIGKILRVTSLDEVPQIINVLKGEMSLIGPRASMASALGTFLDDEKDKMKVLPGITGYTQAYYRNSISVREKRIMDAWYANNVTLSLDSKIFCRTIRTIVKRESVYTVNN